MGDSLETLIARTQEQLQPLIAKPKLADKLLAKPPFRFLHDVFTAVTQSTGFAKGLYNDFELGSANLKDKPQKTAFLDKMIVCVGQCLGKDVDVRSSKIVAGLEPENTNLLLQGLAQAAKDKSLDWGKAVQAALSKVPSFTAEGEVAPGAAPASATSAPAAEAAAATRPSSKDRSGSAEAKEKEKVSAPERKAESKGSSEAAPAVAAAPPRSAESKGETQIPPASSKQSAPETSRAPSGKESRASIKDNNLDEALLQSIAECNGDVERTKTLVEQVISKPKMSPKLLGKPPFRFLHDIISEVTRVTGFAEGLFSGEELDSGAIKEKGPKMDYLTKIIQCVGCQLNVEVEAKPAKIVAGLEPEATCKFLQLLTVACKAGSSNEAVQRVLAGDTAVRSGNTKKPASRERTPETKQPSRSSTPPDNKPRVESQPAAEAKEKPKEAEPGSFSGPMKPLAVKGLAGDPDNDNDGGNLRFGGAAEAKTDDGDDGGARMGTSAPGTSGTSRTSRPTTARRRPPKLKENVTEVGRLMVPDAKAVPVASIMKDGDNNDTDSEDEAVGAAGGDDNSNQPHSALLPGDAGAHGRLVRDILKDQNAEEAARRAKEGEDTAAAATTEAETGIRLGRRKKSFKPERMKSSSAAAASSLAEMNALRADIQRLCQAANPVGKSVEFVHEDLDAMSKELEFWRKEYARKRDALADEQKRTEDALQPLQVQLREVEEQVKEQLHKINTLKAVIAKNEEKTQQLLRMVVSA
ncbi:unnamed protein product [Phytophthora lilii]|uniref:TRAF3-interacting protein 1 n=1 Tax=Phytophthora lilii TaxID=2077276 RepID=A0A9W6WRN8_9STRA|nr:unnamed protein product [Phytophthora lilii]